MPRLGALLAVAVAEVGDDDQPVQLHQLAAGALAVAVVMAHA